MPYKHGKFTGTASSSSSTPRERTAPASSPKEKSHAPHGDVGEKHVTETHPGQTQPHPHTGVHAFHARHTGGGKYESHTHHDGGEVEKRTHPNASEMHSAMHEALPDTEQENPDQDRDVRDGGMEFGESLGTGIGGA